MQNSESSLDGDKQRREREMVNVIHRVAMKIYSRV